MKTTKLFLAGLLTAAMIGCSSKPEPAPEPTQETTPEPTQETTPAPSQPAATEPTWTDGLAEGYLGTVMPTAWFEFTVTNAKLVKEFEGHAAPEGYDILVTDVTLKNTYGQTIPMYNSDFQAQWFDDADDAYALPFFVRIEGQEIEEEYGLGINEKASAVYAFEVPEGNRDFSLSFQEYYANGDYGDLFFVYFTIK
ncbi:MAG: hypothetical protein K6E41_01185 [Solobacterium sp.]|nr:hypothetical protein [Solobacterium sp.]